MTQPGKMKYPQTSNGEKPSPARAKETRGGNSDVRAQEEVESW